MQQYTTTILLLEFSFSNFCFSFLFCGQNSKCPWVAQSKQWDFPLSVTPGDIPGCARILTQRSLYDELSSAICSLSSFNITYTFLHVSFFQRTERYSSGGYSVINLTGASLWALSLFRMASLVSKHAAGVSQRVNTQTHIVVCVADVVLEVELLGQRGRAFSTVHHPPL